MEAENLPQPIQLPPNDSLVNVLEPEPLGTRVMNCETDDAFQSPPPPANVINCSGVESTVGVSGPNHIEPSGPQDAQQQPLNAVVEGPKDTCVKCFASGRPQGLPPVFPLEFWINIIGYLSHQHTLAQLARVNHVFHHFVESKLYRNVCTYTDTALSSLLYTLHTAPRRISHIQSLHLLNLISASPADALVCGILKELRRSDLQEIELIFLVKEHQQFTISHTLGKLRFPKLRVFSTNGFQTIAPLMQFYAAHPLEELHIFGHASLTPRPNTLQKFTKICLPSVRSLSGGAWMLLQDRFLVPQLQHFWARYEFYLDVRPSLIALSQVKIRLVSLRISIRIDTTGLEEVERLTPGDICAMFRHLRYLHITLFHHTDPHVSSRLFDWDRSEAHPSVMGHLTICWEYTENTSLLGVTTRIRPASKQWHEFVEERAMRLLTDWSDCVEDVIFKLPCEPWVFLSWNAEHGPSVVRTVDEDDERMFDYWKTVGDDGGI